MPGFHCTRWRFPVRCRAWLPIACNLENRNTVFREGDGKTWFLHGFVVFVRGPILRFGGMFLCPRECLPRGGSCLRSSSIVSAIYFPRYMGCWPGIPVLEHRTRVSRFGPRIRPRRRAKCRIPGTILPGYEYRKSPGSGYAGPERELTGNNRSGRQLVGRGLWIQYSWSEVLHVV